MTKNCEHCQKEFEAKRKTARFCGTKCRVASTRARQVTGEPPRGKTNPTGPRAPTGVPIPVDDFVAGIRAELEEAGRAETWLGRQALVLAARMRAGTHETGSSYAALSKELRQVMADAMTGVKTAGDPIDELQERRERKLFG